MMIIKMTIIMIIIIKGFTILKEYVNPIDFELDIRSLMTGVPKGFFYL